MTKTVNSCHVEYYKKYRTRKVQITGLHNSAKISFHFIFSFHFIASIFIRLLFLFYESLLNYRVMRESTKKNKKLIVVIDPFKTEVNCNFNS